MKWKYKAAEKNSVSFAAFATMLFGTYHFLLFISAPGPYLSLNNLLLSIGISLFLGALTNVPPSNYYRNNGFDSIFAVKGLPLYLKTIYLLLAPFFIFIVWLRTGDTLFSDDIFKLISELLGLLLFIAAMYMQIRIIIINRHDYIRLNKQEIVWKDNRSGEHKIAIVDINSALIKAKKNLHIELKNGEKQIIHLEALSLTGYAKAISAELKAMGL